jgi:broad specificity phosphatase PhoE
MKIYFIRHGEAMDDVENRYGGWADFPLSPKGVE